MHYILEIGLLLIFCDPAEWLIYQAQGNFKMAYKGFEFKYDGFKCLHVRNNNAMQLATIDIWNMNFARFISQKNKKTFNYLIVTTFWQSS